MIHEQIMKFVPMGKIYICGSEHKKNIAVLYGKSELTSTGKWNYFDL
jgi:hypothetical protein